MAKGGPREIEALVRELLAHALGLPEAWLDHPWGEDVAKVGKKVFVFFGTGDLPREQFGFGVKLPESAAEARLLPFCEPAGYGLGKSGWVTVKLRASELELAPTFRRWIEESYRAVAPKKLAKLVGAAPEPASAPSPARSAKKKAARKKKRAR